MITNIIDNIKKQLEKPASIFSVGGFKPTYVLSEPLIGQVNYYLPQEEIPKDNDDKFMFPLIQLPLFHLPYVPNILKDIRFLTVFISENFNPNPNHIRRCFCIREYKNENYLVEKKLQNSSSYISPFPLSVDLIQNDVPVWGLPDIPKKLMDEIVKLENEGKIDDYYEIFGESYNEIKVGGYPSFIQGTEVLNKNYEFAFQITSNYKANLNIVDNGNLYFAKNILDNSWQIHCDFF